MILKFHAKSNKLDKAEFNPWHWSFQKANIFNDFHFHSNRTFVLCNIMLHFFLLFNMKLSQFLFFKYMQSMVLKYVKIQCYIYP
jgi:hypothetical protein